jgi:outer membrane receptor for ferrienterochelin and colicins
VNHDHDLGEWFAANVQVTRKLWDKHTLTAGFEYRGNIGQDQLNFDESPRAVYFDDMRSSQNFGFFGQGEFQLRSNLLLNAGIRYDNYYSFGTTTNPRLALIYHPWKKTTFKLLYGTAFRAPNAFEAYYAGFGSEPNTQLRPETIQTYEVVFEQDLPYNLRFTTAAYYNRIKNLITQDLDPRNGLLIYQNEDRVDAHGIEAEIEAHYKNGIRARASYALQRTVDQVTGEELTNSPRHLGKFSLSLPLFDEKLCTGLELQYASSVKTLAGNRAHSFLVTNVTLLTKKLFKNFELSASVYNVFDQRYGNPGGDQLTHDIIEQDGRTFRVKANYSF